MLLVSVVCALSFLARKLRPTLREREVVTFYEEDPDAPTVIEKALVPSTVLAALVLPGIVPCFFSGQLFTAIFWLDSTAIVFSDQM